MDTKITFADLDQMIDYWGTDLNDYQVLFQNQSAKINTIVWEVERNNLKIAMIERRLAILHYMHMKLEGDLLNANVFSQTMEPMIKKLENQLMTFEGEDFLDGTREIYSLFEKTDINLNCYKNQVELLIRDVKNIEKDNSSIAIEHIAKIMTALLRTLDYIEMQMEHMKNRMHWIDHEIRCILCEKFHKN